MTDTTHVGRFTIKVRIEPAFRFTTLYYGQVHDAATLVSETRGVANYEVAKAEAVAVAMELATPHAVLDELHDDLASRVARGNPQPENT